MATAVLYTLGVYAGDKGYKVVEEDGYAYRVVSEGLLKDRVAWVFDTPEEGSDPLSMLLKYLGAANDIVWASYKPTHPDIVEMLNGNTRASGVYDFKYCGTCCAEADKINDRIKPISLGVYKPAATAVGL